MRWLKPAWLKSAAQEFGALTYITARVLMDEAHRVKISTLLNSNMPLVPLCR
jgi:hypothetical protein